jgi:hypothetical protein
MAMTTIVEDQEELPRYANWKSRVHAGDQDAEDGRFFGAFTGATT